MSRIGKAPVAIPDKVEVKIDGLTVKVKGPNGQLSHTFNNGYVLYFRKSFWGGFEALVVLQIFPHQRASRSLLSL